MLKRNIVQETKPVPPEPADDSVQPAPDTPSADELGRLRDILFGSQSRSTDKRLGDLETELKSARQEMADRLSDRVNALTESTSTQFTDTRREFNEKLDRQGMDQSSQLRNAQKDLSERLERQSTDFAGQLGSVQKQLSDAIDKLAADLLRQVRETHRELSERIDKLGAEQTERTRNLQAESRQRDDTLRQELIAMADSLDGRKTSRNDLGQMLMELGLRLRQDSDKSS
jgi:gas vesicle protein